MNIKIITSNLLKILFIVENFEDNTSPFTYSLESLTANTVIDFPLFKFLYSHKNKNFSLMGSHHSRPIVYEIACKRGAFDVIEFALSNENENNMFLLFKNSIFTKDLLANFVLNIIVQLMNSNDEKSLNIVDGFKNLFNVDEFLIIAVQNYDEDLIVSICQIFDVFNSMENLFNFIMSLSKFASTKMILSLFKRLIIYLPNHILNCFVPIFATYGFKPVSDFIKENISK